MTSTPLSALELELLRTKRRKALIKAAEMLVIEAYIITKHDTDEVSELNTQILEVICLIAKLTQNKAS